MESKMTAKGGGKLKGGGTEQKGKRTIDMDNCVVISGAGGTFYKATK